MICQLHRWASDCYIVVMCRNILKSFSHFLSLLLVLMCSSILLSSASYAQGYRKKPFVLVIDAGHGGKDIGTSHNGQREKDIALDVALKVGNLIKKRYPEVKILYTRSTDVFVPLDERANFANRNNADLFISVHVNSAVRAPGVEGTETYVLGSDDAAKHARVNKTNLEVVMRENQVIVQEDNYKTTYEGFDPTSTESYIMFSMIKNKHLDQSVDLATAVQRAYRRAGRRAERGVRPGNLLVLRKTAMPSILTEVGFITNLSEASFMGTDYGRLTLASAIANGFSEYYSTINPSKKAVVALPKENTVESAVIEADTSQEDYELTAPLRKNFRRVKSSAKPSSRQDTPNTENKNQSNTTSTNTVNINNGITFSIQLISPKRKISCKDPELKGYEVRCEKVGSRYAYMHGSVTTLKEARQLQKKVQKKFKDAFIVKYQNGKRIQSIY